MSDKFTQKQQVIKLRKEICVKLSSKHLSIPRDSQKVQIWSNKKPCQNNLYPKYPISTAGTLGKVQRKTCKWMRCAMDHSYKATTRVKRVLFCSVHVHLRIMRLSNQTQTQPNANVVGVCLPVGGTRRRHEINDSQSGRSKYGTELE